MNTKVRKPLTVITALILAVAVIAGITARALYSASADVVSEGKHEGTAAEAGIEEIIYDEAVASNAKIMPYFQRNDGSVNFGITSYGSTAEEARAESMKVMASITKSLTAIGIDTNNLSCFNYSCYPERNNHGIIMRYCVSTYVTISIPETDTMPPVYGKRNAAGYDSKENIRQENQERPETKHRRFREEKDLREARSDRREIKVIIINEKPNPAKNDEGRVIKPLPYPGTNPLPVRETFPVPHNSPIEK